MNKLLFARAVKWASARIHSAHTVRNWTHADAQRYLEQAWLAGARSLDKWHRDQQRRPIHCAACGRKLDSAGRCSTECVGLGGSYGGGA